MTASFEPPDQLLLRARCTGCGHFAGEYWRARGWDTSGATCTCTERTPLPEGESLTPLVARARRRNGPLVVRV